MTLPDRLYTPGVLVGCALIVTLGVLMPRALSFLPALVALMSLAVWPLFYPDRPRPLSKPALLFAAGVLVLALGSALWAIDPSYAVQRAGKIAGPVLGGALLFGVLGGMDRAVVMRWWWALPLITLVLCLSQALEYHNNFLIYHLIRGIDVKVVVPIFELNRASVVLCVLAPLMAALVWLGLRGRGANPVVCTVGAALYALAFLPLLAKTGAQSAQIGFAASFMVLALMPVRWRGIWAMLSVLFCVVMIAFPFVVPKLFSSLPQIAYRAGEDSASWVDRANVMPRLEVWDYISRYALQRPMTGFGIEATRIVPAFDTREIYQPGKTNLHPHNGILQIWIEFGALGIALGCAAGIWLIYRIRRLGTPFQQRLSLSVFAGVMAIGLVGFGLWQGWWLGLVGLSTGLAVLLIRSSD